MSWTGRHRYSRIRGCWATWWINAALVNVVIFFVILLLTSPTYLIKTLDELGLMKLMSSFMHPLVANFMPSIILASISALTPWLVAASEDSIRHWTVGIREMAVQTRTFAFLVIVTLIIPSLGLTGLPAFFYWLTAPYDQDQPTLDLHNNVTFSHHFSAVINSSSATFDSHPYPMATNLSTLSPLFAGNTLPPLPRPPIRLECIFLPDGGALFVNYVISCSLIGVILSLLRPASLFSAIRLRLFTVHSLAEQRMIAKAAHSVDQPFCVYLFGTPGLSHFA
ncbi:unnamed protein product [Protopolystoma xenopodis]|uniref:CSC1/OSCA1-like 7TM region domain-containing protein n=1 Tax=Protopolystoma xenopodis TaxID=117903 RepID=A0A3S5AR03_9PLAT|nr:unnamed protein product [Protopolystoma xenopodis]